ncbi:two-component sensor histidine kinase [Streptomyces sp. AV19]|uniref:sensor histidine kinase n=1 Tax=Streptomyces sp. AV19 TaxID=2793068 RepID=UPI0018FF0A9C|nr:histidine kinase [Streptomyces sp. AV19]MBH1936746.1 two-component sensor histidine kinase [Streptomyces sp. AV19]MDG4532806.1 histidine kinase [Streptomyces sp. AV19]
MTRTAAIRDRAADLGFFLFAGAFSVVTADNALAGRELSEEALFADQLTGGLACAALFLRRRWPVQLAAALLVAGSFSHFVTGPALVALFTVAARQPPRVTRWIAALAAAPGPFFVLRQSELSESAVTSGITYYALVTCAFGWGLYVHSRHRLIAELRERAERAGAEARRQAREDIAREMHDVLAHRLSLLSVHAGALEFRPDAPPEDVRRASAIIRASAHQALEDLREIIGVLRLPAGEDDPERPQPTLGDLPRLVEESRGAGMRVDLGLRVDDAADVPAATGRTVYRIVQEGLTNARKHAPDAAVAVTVCGGPGAGIEAEVRNALPQGAPSAVIPGAGQGLTGLAERARLAGGRLEHGRTGGHFVLRARLPWPSPRRTPAPAPAQEARPIG